MILLITSIALTGCIDKAPETVGFDEPDRNETLASNNLEIDDVQAKYYNQSYSVGALNALVKSFGESEVYPDFNLAYPEYFAGVYLNEHGAPVVVVTDDSQEITDYIKSKCGEDVIILLKKHSFHELLSTMQLLHDFFLNIKICDKYPAIRGLSYGLDEKNNVVKGNFFIDVHMKHQAYKEAQEILRIVSKKVPDKTILAFGVYSGYALIEYDAHTGSS